MSETILYIFFFHFKINEEYDIAYHLLSESNHLAVQVYGVFFSIENFSKQSYIED